MTSKTPYAELRKWFMDNMVRFPSELRTPYLNYIDLKKSINAHIIQIDNEVSRLGKDARYSALAKSSKMNLFELYLELNKKLDHGMDKKHTSKS